MSTEGGEPSSFAPGVLLWGKYGEWPWWPCRVIDWAAHNKTPKKGKVLLYFYNDNDKIGALREDRVAIYSRETKAKYMPRKSNADYAAIMKGVEELEQDMNSGNPHIVTISPRASRNDGHREDEPADDVRKDGGEEEEKKKKKGLKRPRVHMEEETRADRLEKGEQRKKKRRKEHVRSPESLPVGKKKKLKRKRPPVEEPETSPPEEDRSEADIVETRKKKKLKRNQAGERSPRKRKLEEKQKESRQRVDEQKAKLAKRIMAASSEKRFGSQNGEESRRREKKAKSTKGTKEKTASLDEKVTGKDTRPGSLSLQGTRSDTVVIDLEGEKEDGQVANDERHNEYIKKVKSLEDEVKSLESNDPVDKHLKELSSPPPIAPFEVPSVHEPVNDTSFSYEQGSEPASKERLRRLLNRIEESTKMYSQASTEERKGIQSAKTLCDDAEEVRGKCQKTIDELVEQLEARRQKYRERQAELEQERLDILDIVKNIKNTLNSFHEDPKVSRTRSRLVELKGSSERARKYEAKILKDLSRIAELGLDAKILAAEKPAQTVYPLIKNKEGTKDADSFSPSTVIREAANRVLKNWMIALKQSKKPSGASSAEDENEQEKEARDSKGDRSEKSEKEVSTVDKKQENSAPNWQVDQVSPSSPELNHEHHDKRRSPASELRPAGKNVKRSDMIVALATCLHSKAQGMAASKKLTEKVHDIAVAIENYSWDSVSGDKDEYYRICLGVARNLRKKGNEEARKLLQGTLQPDEYAKRFVGDPRSPAMSPTM